MSEFLGGILVSFLALCVAGLVWTTSASTIAMDCRTVGVFYVGEKVYECKERK